jgi:arylsulfatase A-like enzyme
LNIIVVVSDSLRRDHINAYGNKQMFTPSFDRFAEQSIVFDYCRPRSFPTVPTRSELLTGAVNFMHWGWGPLPKGHRTLPEHLGARGYNVPGSSGYHTTAVVDTPFYLRDGYGYDQGFETFFMVRGQYPGTETPESRKEWRYETDRCAPTTFLTAERWLQQHSKEEFFLLVDAWDPHEPWDAPAFYTERYLPDYDGKPAMMPIYGKYRDAGISDETIAKSHAAYQGEVTMVDRWFGHFMENLDLLGLTDNTAVILLSDHGHYFGEHGFFGKMVLWKPGEVPYMERALFRSPLYEEITRVPLMIRLPGYKPRRVDALVSVPDVMPTVLELAGVKAPKSIPSKSLLPILNGDVDDVQDHTITSSPLANGGEVSRIVDAYPKVVEESSPITISTKDWTFLDGGEGGPHELYRISTDPHQKKNVYDANKDVAEQLHKKVVEFLRQNNTEPSLLKSRLSL